ncbi:MAG TPA: DoxX family protein [Ignavibacteriales bacterium]|nr:DoxX family protein [Ignavibacteriales bacterium]
MQNYNIYQDSALLILRVVTAAIFYVAAYIKFPFWSNAPEGISSFLLFTTRLLSIAEPLGATAVLVGFLTRWASAGLTIILTGAIIVTKYVYGIGFVTPTSPGWDFPLAVLAGCLILIAFGAGRFSIDGRKKQAGLIHNLLKSS